MATTMTNQELIKAYDLARFEPAGQQRAILDKVEQSLNGEQYLVDPTNPFMFLLEAAVTASAYSLQQAAILTRKQYPSLAVTEEDLYLHMTDRDYADRFAQPALANITFFISREEIQRVAVATGVGGIRKVTIARNTEFTVGTDSFTLEYPIDIRLMSHGGISVVYGEASGTPLHPLETNIINPIEADIDGVPCLMLTIPAYQFKITRNTGHLNAATVFNEAYPYVDRFYYCRVFTRNEGATEWTEMRTTHTDQVFDPTVPTALLKVLNQRVYVKIPQIYYTDALLSGEIRVDVYTTKASNNVVLSAFNVSDWSVRYVDPDNEDNGIYTAAMNLISTYGIYSDSVTTGAREALTFEELRARVMDHNAGQIVLPITNVNARRKLADLGYAAVTEVDLVTQRVIFATRSLPLPTDGATITPANCGIGRITLKLSDLDGHYGVSVNGERTTLHPTLLYRNDTGAPTLVDQMELDSVLALTSDGRARRVNSENYLFTPFHYVLDATGNTFTSKAYYLDAPSIQARRFIEQNDTAALEIATANLSLTVVEGGYKLTLITQSGETYQVLKDDQLYVQLCYKPPGEDSYAYLNGTLVGVTAAKERVWEFFLGTNYEIDRENNLYLNTFSMFNDETRNHPISLTCEFDILYLVADYSIPGMLETDIDLLKSRFLLPVQTIGVLQERATLTLGYALDYLWSGNRTVPTSNDYETYDVDIPARYELDVYKKDENDAYVFEQKDGQFALVKEHSAGEIRKSDSGEVIYAARAGDLKYDVNGNPVIKESRKLARQVDLMFLDGKYYFANDTSATSYKQYLRETVRDWTVTDLGGLNKLGLEETDIYFYPRTSLGDVNAIVKDGEEVTLPAEQAFKVLLYLTQLGYQDSSLKANLGKMVMQVLAAAVEDGTVSTLEMMAAIKEQGGEQLPGAEVSGLGGANNYAVVSLKDDAQRLSIRKKLVAKPDGFYGVEDDAEIGFIRHTPGRSQG